MTTIDGYGPPAPVHTLDNVSLEVKWPGVRIDVGRLAGIRIGSYHLDEQLGRGAHGAVYRTQVVIDGEIIDAPVALKILDPARHEPGRMPEEFRHWTQAHPHLLRVIGHPGQAEIRDDEGGGDLVYWYATELAEDTLELQLRRRLLTAAEALTLIREIGSALAHLHRQGIVHGDVKPGNILRVGGVWKLGDRALMRREGHDDGRLRGTTRYLAPECVNDPAPKRGWDIWAFGLTVLEAVTGVHPKAGLKNHTMPEYLGSLSVTGVYPRGSRTLDRQWISVLTGDAPLPLPALPDEVAAMVRGCLEKDPGRRWRADDLIATVEKDSRA